MFAELFPEGIYVTRTKSYLKSIYWCGSGDFNVSQSAIASKIWSRLKYWIIEWISMKLHTDNHGPWRMKPTDFGHPVTHPLVPPRGHVQL